VKSAQRCSAVTTRQAPKFTWLSRGGTLVLVICGLAAVPVSDAAFLTAVTVSLPVLGLCWIVNDDGRSRRLVRLVRALRAGPRAPSCRMDTP